MNEADLAKVKFGKGAVISKSGDWDLEGVKGSWDKATLISEFDVDETALDEAFVGDLYANEVAEFTFDVANGQSLALADATEGFKAELYADSNPYNPLLVWDELNAGQYTLRISVADTYSLDKDEELSYSFKATLA